MKRALIVLTALGGALVVALLQFRSEPSALPEFDAAEFLGRGPGARMESVKFSGAEVAEIRRIFEDVPADSNPEKWQVFGNLKLLKDGQEVLDIGVFSNSNGPGPFRFSQDRYFLGYDQEVFRTLLRAGGESAGPSR